MTDPRNNMAVWGGFLALSLILGAGPLAAECYADYKAKRENPLRLHYGVIELPQNVCDDPAAAKAQAADRVAARIAVDGWLLLTIVSTFDEGGLGEKKESAGEFYLRY